MQRLVLVAVANDIVTLLFGQVAPLLRCPFLQLFLVDAEAVEEVCGMQDEVVAMALHIEALLVVECLFDIGPCLFYLGMLRVRAVILPWSSPFFRIVR